MTDKRTEFILIKAGITNVYLFSNGEKSVLVDTGSKGSANHILDQIRKSGLKPSDICLIILTHTHFDHSGNLKILVDKTGAKVLVHKKEATCLSLGFTVIPKGAFFYTKFLSWAGRKLFTTIGHYLPVIPDIIVDDKFDLSVFGLDGYLLPLPGHTDGSLTLIIGHQAFVGDNMVGMIPGRVFPAFVNDIPLLMESWKLLIDSGCTAFYPGHGKMVSIDQLKSAFKKQSRKRRL